jgi:3'-phosphoadenosine 5'-phosphosulfate sulfotransferase
VSIASMGGKRPPSAGVAFLRKGFEDDMVSVCAFNWWGRFETAGL